MPDIYVDAETGQPINMVGQSSNVPQFGPQKSDKADLLYLIRPDLIVETIKNQLMGLKFNSDSGKWEKDPALTANALTPFGASLIANLMLPASSQNVSISNLKDKEIKDRVKNICKTAIFNAVTQHKEMGVYNSAQLRFINDIVFTNTLVSLKQPENEGIRRLLGHIVSEQRSTQTIQDEKRGGLLSLFSGRGKK